MEDLRMLIRIKNIPMWKIAENVGVSEMTIYRWMRTYNAEHHKKIMDTINKIEGDTDE